MRNGSLIVAAVDGDVDVERVSAATLRVHAVRGRVAIDTADVARAAHVRTDSGTIFAGNLRFGCVSQPALAANDTRFCGAQFRSRLGDISLAEVSGGCISAECASCNLRARHWLAVCGQLHRA